MNEVFKKIISELNVPQMFGEYIFTEQKMEEFIRAIQQEVVKTGEMVGEKYQRRARWKWKASEIKYLKNLSTGSFITTTEIEKLFK